MTWETLHVTIVAFFLQRFYLITYLSILLITYGFAQSFGSVLASQLVKKYRANRVLATAMFLVALESKQQQVFNEYFGFVLTIYTQLP